VNMVGSVTQTQRITGTGVIKRCGKHEVREVALG
jgi:hypothetical protein